MQDRRKPDLIQSLVEQLRSGAPAQEPGAAAGGQPVTFNLASGAISVASGATLTLVLGGCVRMDGPAPR